MLSQRIPLDHRGNAGRETAPVHERGQFRSDVRPRSVTSFQGGGDGVGSRPAFREITDKRSIDRGAGPERHDPPYDRCRFWPFALEPGESLHQPGRESRRRIERVPAQHRADFNPGINEVGAPEGLLVESLPAFGRAQLDGVGLDGLDHLLLAHPAACQ